MGVDYQNLLDKALRNVVKEVLIYAQFNGLDDKTRFFITFKTDYNGVVIPAFLKAQYPDLMTIVLQNSYSYNNLNVSDREFGVQLTFDGRPCYIRVPFASLIEFKDPSVDFILPFNLRSVQNNANENFIELPLEVKETIEVNPKIINLDDYRKKK